MRNLLLILLLANILYFAWEQATEEPEDRGVEILDRRDIGPPLAIADARTVMAMRAAAEREEAEVQEETSATLPFAFGNPCVTIGPFANSAEAERVLTTYRNQGMRGIVRSTQGQIFVGHWVQITKIPNREIGDEMLKRLVAGGLSDAYLIPGDDGLKISLGLFGDLERAERIELQAEALNIPAEIQPRMREGMVFYVDLELPPGRGASEMIQRFGEGKVLLRERASCPTG